jgi:hypothetical protein
MALTPGILFVASHFSWKDTLQLITGKVTLEINTPLGSTRKEFELSAGDILAIALQIVNLMTAQATAFSVPVLQLNVQNFELLQQSLSFASGIWPG